MMEQGRNQGFFGRLGSDPPHVLESTVWVSGPGSATLGLMAHLVPAKEAASCQSLRSSQNSGRRACKSSIPGLHDRRKQVLGTSGQQCAAFFGRKQGLQPH